MKTFLLGILAFSLGVLVALSIVFGMLKVVKTDRDLSTTFVNPNRLPLPLKTNPSENEKVDFFYKISAIAKSADVIILNNCQAVPNVVKTQNNTKVKFKNKGVSTTILSFEQSQTFQIAAGATVEVLINKSRVPGLYSYYCNKPIKDGRSFESVLEGYLLVTP